MKPILKYLLTIHISLISLCANAQTFKVKGRIIDENMVDVVGAQVKNLKNNRTTAADDKGFYTIRADIGDTLTYRFVGLTEEKRIVADSFKHINVLLMDKTVNDLGIIWTKRQWKKAYKQTNRLYKKLEGEASRLGKWNY